MMREGRAHGLVIIAFLLFVVGGYVVYPFAVMTGESLVRDGRASLDQYRALFDPANVASREAVRNSVTVSLLSVLCSGVLGTFLAFVLTQAGVRMNRILSRIAILPIALPPLVGVIAMLFVFGESGIIPRGFQNLFGLERPPFFLDGPAAIVAVHTYSFNVYFVLLVSTALSRIDGSLLEAAASLRSSQWNTIRKVMFPVLRPALLGASALTFMSSMASFSAPLLFGGTARFMTTQIYSSKLNGDMALASAQAVGLTLLSVAFFVMLRTAAAPGSVTGGTKGAARFQPLRVEGRVRGLMLGAACAVLLLELLPLFTIVLISLTREGSWTWQVLPSAYTLANFQNLFADPEALDPILKSVLMSVLTLVCALVVGVSAAYLITRRWLRGWRAPFDILVTLPFAIPGTVVALSLILAFNRPGVFTGFNVIVGTFWILPLAYFIRMYPLIVRSTAAAFAQLDESLLEAGEILGAGFFRRFRKIIFPLIRPGIVSGSVLVLIAALGELVSSILLYTYANRPISIEILSQLRMYNIGAAAAYCVVLLVLITAVTSVSRRRSFEF